MRSVTKGSQQDLSSLAKLLTLGFAFLLMSVPLLPFRYLFLPDWAPGVLVHLVHYTPVGVSLWVGILWYGQRRKRVAEALSHTPLGWPVGAVLLTGIVSSLGTNQPLVSMAKTLYYFSTGGLLYLVLVDLLDRRERVRLLLYLFLVTAYIAAFYGLLEFATGQNLLYSRFFSPENEAYRRLIPDPWFGRRIVGTIGHPVILGSYLVLVFPISLSVALNARKRWQQAILLVGTLNVLGALLLTFTRGAWLAVMVSIGIYLKLRGTKHLLVLPLSLAVLAGVVLSFSGIGEVVEERFQDAYDNYILNFTSTTRGAAYGYVAAISAKYPLMGLGTGMYRFKAYELRKTLDIPTPLGVLDTPDNMYLMWLAENGAMGLVAAVYVLALLFRELWKAGKRETDSARQDLAWGFIAAFAGLCVDMLTVDVLYFHVTRTIFWIVMGIAVVLFIPKPQTADYDEEH
jgi:putative inorganic carbon (hco3(-)) transporter